MRNQWEDSTVSERCFYFVGLVGGKTVIDWLDVRDQAVPFCFALKRITCKDFTIILGANGITKNYSSRTHSWKPTLYGSSNRIMLKVLDVI